jgi:release factor glutamine methyltransferase
VAFEAEVLLGEVLGLSRGALFARGRELLAPEAAERFEALVARRAAREPLQHVVGHWPFLGLDLLTDRRALVPRPETEDLALLAIARLPEDRDLLVLDAGTGSGCLALALAAARPRARVVALERDAAALFLARENRARCGLEKRVGLVRSDLCGALADGPRFDLAVANLPYVREDEFDALEPEVREHDPRAALVAAGDGLAIVREFARQVGSRLAPGAAVLLECAPDQAVVVGAELAAAGWSKVRTHADRYGRARIVSGDSNRKPVSRPNRGQQP